MEHQSLEQHLKELRKRIFYSLVMLLIAICICYYYSKGIYNFFLIPLADIYKDSSHHKMIYTGLTEAFFTYLKLASYAGFFISFPFIAMQFYIFLAPGLYKNEKKVLIPFLVAAPILFLLGGMMVYYLVFPLAWKFFLSFELKDSLIPILFEARISEYLSLVLHLIFAFGIAFQLPIILTLLAKVGVINSDFLIKKRKIAIVIIFAVAAVITPPDVISQIALALPMMVLYEISVKLTKLIEAKPS